MPPQPVVPEGLAEPSPVPGAGAGASGEATQAETTVEAPALSSGETGPGQRPLALWEAPKEPRVPRRSLPLEQGTYRISDPSTDFLFFSFF